MEFNKRQSEEIIEALLKHNGHPHSRGVNGSVKFRMLDEKIHEASTAHPFDVESKLGFRIHDLPNDATKLGGVSIVKDNRKLTSIIKKTLLDTDLSGLPDRAVAERIVHELIGSGMSYNGHDDLSMKFEKLLSVDLGVHFIVNQIQLSGSDMYWEEHYSRAPKINENDPSIEMKGGVKYVKNGSDVLDIAKQFFNKPDSSFDSFMMDFHKHMAYSNISLSIHEQSGVPSDVPIDVENILKDGFSLSKRTGNLSHLFDRVSQLKLKYTPLDAAKRSDPQVKLDAIKEILALDTPEQKQDSAKQVIDSEAESAFELVEKMSVREEIWKWQSAVSDVKNDPDVSVLPDKLSQAWLKIFPNGLPSLNDLNVRNMRSQLSRVEKVFGNLVDRTAENKMNIAGGTLLGVYPRKDPSHEIVKSIFNDMKIKFDRGSSPEKLIIANAVSDLMSPERAEEIKQSVANGGTKASLLGELLGKSKSEFPEHKEDIAQVARRKI